MLYSQSINSITPGLFLILLDQSGSMKDSYGNCTKASTAAEVVNYMIYELQAACEHEGVIKPRLSLGVIGYGGDKAQPLLAGKIDSFESKQTGQHIYHKGETTCAGQHFSADFAMPVWVKERADGGTPMQDAFDRAFDLAKDWAAHFSNSFPPVIINVTDGEPDNADKARASARRLMDVATSDGNALLFNVHIVEASQLGEIMLPTSTDALKNMPNQVRGFAEFLLDISSTLPDSMVGQAAKAGLPSQTGSRGFIFNASAPTLLKMMKFGTTGVLTSRR